IWFGVLLGVNMQTSFMHPPFGFALFYLRSVAPNKDYVDKITGKMTARITTGQIYKGAIPFVFIQLIMVALVILFPQMVMVYKASDKVFDPAKVQIIIQQEEPQGAGGGSDTNQSPASPYDPPPSERTDDAAQSVQDAFKAPPSEAPKK
ncbi:MAG: TRAP transporter large permease subunit, partial [Betaproteobacteria bacterium]